MSSIKTIAALNRLVAIHERSLAHYLHFAAPHFAGASEQAAALLQLLNTNHAAVVDRCAHLIEQAGARVDLGHFPIVFTGWHDLGFEFLLGKLIHDEQQRQTAIGAAIRDLSSAPLAKAMAEEALGMAKGHLESLRELQAAAV